MCAVCVFTLHRLLPDELILSAEPTLPVAWTPVLMSHQRRINSSLNLQLQRRLKRSDYTQGRQGNRNREDIIEVIFGGGDLEINRLPDTQQQTTQLYWLFCSIFLSRERTPGNIKSKIVLRGDAKTRFKGNQNHTNQS